jgi:hypothetical protein
MKTKKKCPSCQMITCQQIAEGISDHKWYSYYECDECNRIQTYGMNRPAVIQTEYSVSSTISTPIGIDAKDWPNHD